MKIFLSFICFFWTLGCWAGVNPPATFLVKVKSGAIAPFWLESIAKPIGSTNSKKKKKLEIRVKAFEVMAKPVTIKDFKTFLEKNSEWKKENAAGLLVDDLYLKNLEAKELNEELPMTNVSWFVATAYCTAINMRLPTTNEWEYMAAASETKADASANQDFLKRILEWYGKPQSEGLKPVGSVFKNLYGIWDLHGNIWEWVSDFNSSFITGESREDSALNKDMFCGAGGLAGGNKENYAAFMRYAFRSSLKGKSSTNNLGFRCVRSL